MRYVFWLRALGPHLVLAAATSTLCSLFGGPQAIAWCAPLLTGCQLVVWYWTDLLLTDRIKGQRMIRESAPHVGADGKMKKDSEATAWFLLGLLFLGVSVFLVAACRMTAGLVFLAIDLPLLTLALGLSDAFSSFCKHVYPRLREASRNAARAAAERYYEKHQRVTHSLMPPDLFRATLNASIPDDLAPEKAWGFTRDLIARFAPAVREDAQRQEEARVKARQRHRRLSEIDRQIAGLQKNVLVKKASGGEDDAIAAIELEAQLAQLQEERATFLSTH